jgi:hypothetical protein
MTVSVKPFKAYIEEKYLYDMDPTKHRVLTCQVVAVSAYEGQTLTFTVIVRDAMFANIPIWALRWKETSILTRIADKHLGFLNCPNKDIDVFTIEYVGYMKPTCFIKGLNEWYRVEGYIFTVDFFNDNELLHLVMLENYQFAWLPNHKINWAGKEELPDYKKLKQNWNI